MKFRPYLLAIFAGMIAGVVILAYISPQVIGPRAPLPVSGTNASRASAFFPIGVFEDAGIVGGNADKFDAMLRDLEVHSLDSVMFVNNFSERDAPLLATSDKLNFNVLMHPGGDLNETWWPSDVPANAETARRVAQPIVDLFGSHRSFRGYIVKDEPVLRDLAKVTLMTQALRELDRTQPAMPILIGTDRVGPIFGAAQPDAMLIDVYPLGYRNPTCDFRMTGFGYRNFDFVDYIREVVRDKPRGTPLWMILQTHRFGDGGPFSLREPTPTEVRIQNWVAIGEGATGIFWFVYSSQQGWTGLVDNPVLYPEVTQLAQRVGPLRDLLLELKKVEDRFTVTGNSRRYASTLASKDGQRAFVVAVNRDCEHPQSISIDSPVLKGLLHDIESSDMYSMGEPILFGAGDGRMFELINP